MAVRLITDLDAFFAGADDAKQARFQEFFRTAYGSKKNQMPFSIYFERNDYKQLFSTLIVRDNAEAFRSFLDEFHISPDATLTAYGTHPEFLFFLATTSDSGVREDIADSLLENGVNVYSVDPETGLNALMAAVVNYSADGVQYLLSRTEIQPGIRATKGAYAGLSALDIAENNYAELYDFVLDIQAQLTQLTTEEERENLLMSVDMEKKIFDRYKVIIDSLTPVTPRNRQPVVNRNLGSIQQRLRPSMRNVTGIVGIRGKIPANVIRGAITPFLRSGPRLPGIRVAPTEVGLKHVNTSLFANARRRRNTRRGSRKARRDRKTRSRK
jgi:hypothetical protein